MPATPRIFVDANVLIAGVDSRAGASNAVLQMGEIGLFQLVVCRQVLDETERNLRKKRIFSKLRGNDSSTQVDERRDAL